jgi:hypothetical protein
MQFGRFVGDVDARDLAERGSDRRRELLADFSFVRTTGETITAPKGFRYDGASIPRLFWRIIGSPFTGDYRRAAVIHDWLCFLGNRGLTPHSSPSVHQIFYEGMRADGCGPIRAFFMWAAVRLFGPHFKGRL